MNNQITIKRPRWAKGSKKGLMFLSAVTIDSQGAVTPIFYEDWLKKADRCGWKRLSQEFSDTEQTEIWELRREPRKNNEV